MSTLLVAKNEDCRRCGVRLIRGVNLHYLRAGRVCSPCFYGRQPTSLEGGKGTRTSLHAAIRRAAQAPTMAKPRMYSGGRVPVPEVLASGEETIMTNCRLPVPVWEAVKHLAVTERTTLSSLIRSGVERMLQERQRRAAATVK